MCKGIRNTGLQHAAIDRRCTCVTVCGRQDECARPGLGEALAVPSAFERISLIGEREIEIKAIGSIGQGEGSIALCGAGKPGQAKPDRIVAAVGGLAAVQGQIIDRARSAAEINGCEIPADPLLRLDDRKFRAGEVAGAHHRLICIEAGNLECAVQRSAVCTDEGSVGGSDRGTEDCIGILGEGPGHDELG
ncbi:hypothetical protein D3C87_1363870 [compost metagenome]